MIKPEMDKLHLSEIDQWSAGDWSAAQSIRDWSMIKPEMDKLHLSEIDQWSTGDWSAAQSIRDWLVASDRDFSIRHNLTGYRSDISISVEKTINLLSLSRIVWFPSGGLTIAEAFNFRFISRQFWHLDCPPLPPTPCSAHYKFRLDG